MAKFAATDYLVTINGGTVSTNLNSVELAQEADDIETTAFGQTFRTRIGGLKSGTLTLNRDLIKAPKECIEYVIFHELCHLEHHNHGPEFYRLLERSLPDWVKRKYKLEMALI